MNPDFLPSSAVSIQDPDAIALLETLQRQVAPVEIGQTTLPIATAYVRSAPQSTCDTTPILLLHGFDSSLPKFRRLIPRLADEYETWAIDLYGAGLRFVSLNFSLQVIFCGTVQV